MTLRWTGDAAVLEMSRRVAFRLNQIATQSVAELRKELDRPYPPASRPGEFPRKRTGRLRNSVRWVPLRLIGGNYGVAVMYDAEGFYGNILIEQGRKGPADVVERVARSMVAGTGLLRA